MFLETMNRLFGFAYSGSNRTKMLLASTLDLLATGVNVAAPAIIASEFEKYHDTDERMDDTDLYLTIGAGASIVLAQLIPKLRNYLLDSVRANVQKDLTLAMVRKAYSNGLDAHLTERTGDFAQALSKNYSSIDSMMPSFFGEILPFVFDITAITVYLVAEFGIAGAIPAGISVFYFFMAGLQERGMLPLRQACVEESYRGYGAVLRTIGNYQLAHKFNNVKYELEQVEEALVKTEKQFRKVHYRDDTNILGLMSINSLGMLFAFAALLFFPGITKRKLNLVSIVLFGYFLNFVNSKLAALPGPITLFFTSISDGGRVVRFLDAPSAVFEKSDAIALNATGPLFIEFKNVTFTYPGLDSPVIKDISFRVSAGENLAIVGPTGAGKSTIMLLLLRFYDPDSGGIYINNVNIREFTLESLRNAFGICSQANKMFDGTIADNISYGDLDADSNAIAKAAIFSELVKVDGFNDRTPVNFNMFASGKLARDVGKEGGRLSGGEKQRIAIARMLLKGGQACILDEPTNALDPSTEAAVQATLDKATHGITTLTVTHRYSTVAHANQIIYLEKGAIAEQGDFNQLVHKRGLFYGQLQSQCKDLGIKAEDIIVKRGAASQSGTSLSSFWSRRLGLSKDDAELVDFSSPSSPLLGRRGSSIN